MEHKVPSFKYKSLPIFPLFEGIVYLWVGNLWKTNGFDNAEMLLIENV